MTTKLADLVVTGARVWTGESGPEGEEPTAFAVRNGRFVAVGTGEDIAPLARAAEHVIDLGGRRVLPGLQDSHIHAVRAGATWGTELHWEAVRSVADALETIRLRVAQVGEDEWVCVVGGWHCRQFTERRMPTKAELDAVSPENPVFVQMGYECAVLSTAALRLCGWDSADDAPPGAAFDVDAVTGELTGVVRGQAAYRLALMKMPKPSAEVQRAGTRAMLDEFARHGLTAVADAGGFMMTPESYQPVFDLWRAGALPVRLRLFLSASTAGRELEELSTWMRHLAPGFGDDLMRFSGIGELVHLGCHDMEGFDGDFIIQDAPHAELIAISERVAAAGWPMSIHAVLDSSLDRVLSAWEEVARTADLRALRWSVVHADQASPANIARMAALGLGVQVQNRMVLQGTDYIPLWGLDQVRRTPPLGDFTDAGLWLVGGTDGTRANWYQPWTSIEWLVNGSTIDQPGLREARHRLSVAQALTAYSSTGSYMVGEERHRGMIAEGHLADFFVPTKDPFSVPVDELSTILSDWTVVGGHTTHDSDTI
ncbi:amidohydrolase [Streptomyces albipurpureus]|uniref:Amidohydrolase n=1 Tax=Streptomyces albipurpureus TaxID=2897419 RepID=A0ABT0UJS9_9ACTN|nr:amidohydrolase [Streptomyces sp. CWNU-1]MCM2387536.1 amidohydrolase [Streptomyces sp. CWNU-1]